MSGPILAMDLGRRTGWAIGSPGEPVRSGAVDLKRDGEPREVVFSNMIAWLSERIRTELPAMIVKEAPLNLQAFAKMQSAEDTVVMTFGLHALVEGLAKRFGVPCRQIHDATVRKHFLGVGRMGTRKATKAAVVQRCRVLKLVPMDCADEDRCDAIAVHDWACATFGKVRPRELHLFNEAVR